MKAKIGLALLALSVIALLLSLAAAASLLIPANDKAKENAKAPEKSPVIEDNWDLIRVDFIHYVKPASPPKGPKAETCYKLIGVKWKTFPVSYVINPANPQNLSEAFVTSAIAAGSETWDAATSTELFNNSYTVNYSAQYGVQNYRNEIDFGDYPDDSVIAVTTVWYTPVGKRLVEYDMRFNTRFRWGDATVDNTTMDLQNIAVHEKGHGVGLADIYSLTCSAVTMYGYSAYGETSKRTLEQPDITGLQQMYGA